MGEVFYANESEVPSLMMDEEKLDFKRLLPVLVIVLVDLLGLSIIIPLLALYAARFGANAFVIGLLGATYPLMQFLGAPVLGRLSDRFGRKPVLLVSQIGTLAGFILLGLANALWLLFVSRVIDGLSGANLSTAQAVVADSTTGKTRTQGLGLIGALGVLLLFALLVYLGYFVTSYNKTLGVTITPKDIADFAKFPELVWLDRYHWAPTLAMAALMAAAGGWTGLAWAHTPDPYLDAAVPMIAARTSPAVAVGKPRAWCR